MYEAKQSKDLNWVGPVRNGEYPTLAQLNDPANSLIYSVGYRLIEYVRLKWGAEAVTRLILSHRDVKAALGVTPTEFAEVTVREAVLCNPDIRDGEQQKQLQQQTGILGIQGITGILPARRTLICFGQIRF